MSRVPTPMTNSAVPKSGVGTPASPSRSGAPSSHGARPATPSTGGNGGKSAPPSSTGGGSKVSGGSGQSGGGAQGPTPMGGIPPIDQLQGRPIGRVLTKMGKVTRDQVVEALTFQKSKGGALGRILIDLGYIKETELNIALAAQKGYELVNLDGMMIAPEAIAAVPPQIATTNKVLPILFDKAAKKLTVVMASQENFRALDDLRQLMGYTVTAKIGDPDQIEKLINKHYNTAAESLGEVLGELANDESLKDLKGRGESIDLDSLKDA